MTGDPFREAARRFDRIGGAVERGARRAETAGATQFATVARLLAPVETGALRSAIAAEGGAVRIVDTPGDQDAGRYAEEVEYGNDHQAAQPFARPAAALLVTSLPAITRREVGAAVAAEVARIRAGG